VTFVNEKIPEEDKTTNPILAAGIKSPTSDRVVNLNKWTVDRERGAFLMFVQNKSPEIPYYYVFYFKNVLTGLWLNRHHSGNMQEGFDYIWDVTEMIMGDKSLNESDEFRKILSEAFRAHGAIYSHDKVRSAELTIGGSVWPTG
jgi:hypothetical protein